MQYVHWVNFIAFCIWTVEVLSDYSDVSSVHSLSLFLPSSTPPYHFRYLGTQKVTGGWQDLQRQIVRGTSQVTTWHLWQALKPKSKRHNIIISVHAAMYMYFCMPGCWLHGDACACFVASILSSLDCFNCHNHKNIVRGFWSHTIVLGADVPTFSRNTKIWGSIISRTQGVYPQPF